MYEKNKNNNSSLVVINNYDYRTLKKLYENILDEDIVEECGHFLNSKDGMKDMIKCHNLLDEIICYNFKKVTMINMIKLKYCHYQD